jgi:hypothetical protein
MRLLRLRKAYDLAEEGEKLLTNGKLDQSLEAYRNALSLAPEVEEIQFWRGVALIRAGHLQEATFKEVFRKNTDWMHVLRSLPKAGLLKSENSVAALLNRLSS